MLFYFGFLFPEGRTGGIFVMRDQIILFAEKRDLKKKFFVIRDAYVPRDT